MSLYGSELWNYNSRYVEEIVVAWRKTMRKLFRLPYRTHKYIVCGITEDISIKLHHRVTKFMYSMRGDQLTMRGDRQILDGKDYSCSNLHQVPRDVHPAKLAERSNATTLVFGGSTSGHHMLSNFYQIKGNFVYEQISYNSSEQAFQHKKARIAGDLNVRSFLILNPRFRRVLDTGSKD